MNCSLKWDRHKYTPCSCVHMEVFQVIRRFPIIIPSLRSRRLSPCEVHSLVIYGKDVAKFDFWVLNLLNNLELWDFLNILGVQLLQVPLVLMIDLSWRFRDFWSLPFATSFPLPMNSWASLGHPWELDAASGLEFWFVLASSLQHNTTCRLEALSITKLLDAIGLFTDEDLVATELVRFMAVGLDFATILFSFDCSCILFAIL